MITPEQIKLETHNVTIVLGNDELMEIGLRQFALVETKEQSYYIEEMVDTDNPEWVNFDDQVFYFVELWNNETIEELTNKLDASKRGFYIDAERSE